MITVAGFNTAIDRSITIDALLPGSVRRATRIDARPGGKGLHVAQTIAALGEPVQLVGLTDTFHREQLITHLAGRGVQFHGVEMPHPLRCNLAIREESGRSTEILDPGPTVDAAVRQSLLDTLMRCVEGSRCVVMSGSLPPGFPDDTYAALVHTIGLPCLIDASGAALLAAADGGATLLKPNREEAGALAGSPVVTIGEAAAVARQLHARGIAYPVITLGEQGAVGFDGSDLWQASISVDEPGDAVGSGDCLLAGMAVVIARGGDLVEALRTGVACGAANTLHAEAGYVERATVDALHARVQIRKIDG